MATPRQRRDAVARLGAHVRSVDRPKAPSTRWAADYNYFLAQTIREDLAELGITLGSGLELVWTGPLRAAAAALMFELHERAGVRSCRSCGCTDQRGCPGGCSWVGPNKCSACPAGRRR